MTKLFLAALIGAALSLPTLAAPLPSPLSLEEALAYAADHPRTRLAAGEKPPPTRAALYLNCHQLALGIGGGPDERRNQVATELLAPEAAQRLLILARYLDVLLADLSYTSHNEALAVAYILFDRARARMELGQSSELRVAELEAEYEDVLRERAASEASQRLTRALLAQAVGRPGDLPRDLLEPQLPEVPETLPAPHEVVTAARRENAWLDTLKAGGSEALASLIDMELEQEARELLLRLESLAVVARYARTESFLRDLKLDESRTLYEQEVRADLGFSMSQQTRARLREHRVAYCRALALAELAALQGKPVWPPVIPE
jgi:hypothetical protein